MPFHFYFYLKREVKSTHHARRVRKWVIRVGREGFLLSIFFHLFTNFTKRLGIPLRGPKKMKSNKIKKSKIVPGLTAKQFCLSKHCFFVKSTEFSSLLGGKVLGSFALFSSEMSHKKRKGPSSLKQQSLKVQSKVERRSTSRSSSALFNLPLFYLHD